MLPDQHDVIFIARRCVGAKNRNNPFHGLDRPIHQAQKSCFPNAAVASNEIEHIIFDCERKVLQDVFPIGITERHMMEIDQINLSQK